MNNVVLSGRLTQNALCFGKQQETLKFSLACRSGFDPSTGKPKVDFVPCVFFRASPKLRDLLMTTGKGKPVELRGRIATSTYESNGERKYATEVLVDAKDFSLLYEEKGGANVQPRNRETPERDFSRRGSVDYRSPAGRNPDRFDRVDSLVS